MTDNELRELGQKFIDNQKRIWAETHSIELALEPRAAEKLDASFDFLDPLRVGIYLTIKSEEGAFTIDYASISRVCLNPAAFKQPVPQTHRARIGDFMGGVKGWDYVEKQEQPTKGPEKPLVCTTFDGFDDVTGGPST